MADMAKALALVVCMGWVSSALACSCPNPDQAGFVHAQAKRLPANARGALFLPPKGTLEWIGQVDENAHFYTGAMAKLTPASFKITVDGQAASLPVELSYPDMTQDAASPLPTRRYRFARKADEKRALALTLKEIAPLLKSGVLVDSTKAIEQDQRLVRVGPVGGFKPGGRYRIAYVGKAEQWRYPAVIEHAIDATPILVKGVRHRLALDGPPMAKMLSLPTGDGSCGGSEPALVQHFSYVLPADRALYKDALVFASEFRPGLVKQGTATRYTGLFYAPSVCASVPYMSTANPGGRDFLHGQCKAGSRPGVVRGWTGLLEVEDRLHLTDSLDVDLGQAGAASCSNLGILKAALTGGDAAQIAESVCAVNFKPTAGAEAAVIAPGSFPVQALLALTNSKEPHVKACATNVALRLSSETSAMSAVDVARLGAILKVDFRSGNPERIAVAGEGLTQLLQLMETTPRVAAPAKALLGDVLDALVHAMLTDTAAHNNMLPFLLASVSDKAMQHVPRLLAAAAQGPGSGNAITALEVLIPDDPRFHRVLLANAESPRRLEDAALAYARVTGTAQPKAAFALLLKAVRNRSAKASHALAQYGSAARSTVPALVELLGKEPDREFRGVLLVTLLAVGDGDPAAVPAIGDTLNATRGRGASDCSFTGLQNLRGNGKALLPAFEKRMQRPMSSHLKSILAESIGSMGLPGPKSKALLKRLDRVPEIPPA